MAETTTRIAAWLRDQIAYLESIETTMFGGGCLSAYKATLQEVLSVTDQPHTTEIPLWIRTGEFTLFGVVLHCHVLEDGRRIVDAADVAALFAAMAREGDAIDDDDINAEALEAFARWMSEK